MSWRSLHRWISVAIALPFAIILLSGILLASRSFLPWMQPEYSPPSGKGLTVSFEQILSAVRSAPQAGMQSWQDVSQIDIRPKTGQIRVRAKLDHWEVQVDGATGAVLGVGQRRVSWFTSLHQGALFGEFVRYGIFYTSALGVLFLLVSGLVIFTLPYLRRWKARRLENERLNRAAL